MILGPCGKGMFSFVKTTSCLLRWLYHLKYPAINESSYCSKSLPACSVLDFGHSNRCAMVSRCFNLHFPKDMEYLFLCLFALFISSLMRCQSLWSIFLIWLFILKSSFKSSLYILYNSFLLDVSFADSSS